MGPTPFEVGIPPFSSWNHSAVQTLLILCTRHTDTMVRSDDTQRAGEHIALAGVEPHE